MPTVYEEKRKIQMKNETHSFGSDNWNN